MNEAGIAWIFIIKDNFYHYTLCEIHFFIAMYGTHVDAHARTRITHRMNSIKMQSRRSDALHQTSKRRLSRIMRNVTVESDVEWTWDSAAVHLPFYDNQDRRRWADRPMMIPNIESVLSAYFWCVIFVGTQAVKSPSP